MEATTFSSVSFAEGRFRRAYKGTCTAPPSKRGKEIVVKELKDSYTWDAADWDVTLRIHKKASQLSRGFNSFSRTNYPIRFTVYNVTNQSTDPNSRPKLGESVIVEEYIAGEFKKWCSNYGFISAESQSMPTFMHWSWVHTRGEMMVGDLQGVWKHDGFLLTDPVIISLKQQFWPNRHRSRRNDHVLQSTQVQQSLPRPTPSDFISSVPQHKLRECMGKLAQLQAATTYTVDLNLSPRTRQIVASVLRSVAK